MATHNKNINEDRVILPPDLPCDIPDIPTVLIQKLANDSLRIKGDGLHNSDLDDLPNYSTFSKGIRKWFTDNYVVNMDTYGGRVTEKGKGIDLSCLFYSALKAISPELQNVSNPYESDKAHLQDRGFITHTFKKNIAEYLFTDLDQPDQTEIDYIVSNAIEYSDLTDRQIYTKVLENKIKIKYIVFNILVRRKFYLTIERKYNLNNSENKTNFIARLKSALEERNELLNVKNQYEDRVKNDEVLDDNDNELLLNIISSLRDPELEYNIIFEEFSQLFPDPRLHLWTFDDISSIDRQGFSNHYAFSHEIRQLSVTTGLFNLPILFDVLESDFRGDEFGGSHNTPLDGKYKPETIIDQMLYRKEHGIASLDLICQVTGFNAYCLDSTGEPHKRYSSRGSYTQDFDIVKLIYDRIVTDKWSIEDVSSQDPKAPCFIIKFEPGHFESVAVLHEMDISECNMENKKIFQSQSIFSYYDPFIVAMRERVIFRIEEEKRKDAERKKREKEERENPKPKTITIRPGGTLTRGTLNPARSLISRAKRPDITQSQKFDDATAELEDEGLLNRATMSKQEQLSLIKDIVASLNIAGEEGTVEHYIDKMASAHSSKANTPVKKEEEDLDFSKMTHKQRITYLDKESPEWRDFYNNVKKQKSEEQFVAEMLGISPPSGSVWNPKVDDYEDTGAGVGPGNESISVISPSGKVNISTYKPASPTPRSASPTPRTNKTKRQTRLIRLSSNESE